MSQTWFTDGDASADFRPTTPITLNSYRDVAIRVTSAATGTRAGTSRTSKARSAASPRRRLSYGARTTGLFQRHTVRRSGTGYRARGFWWSRARGTSRLRTPRT